MLGQLTLDGNIGVTAIIGLIQVFIVIGGFIYQNGKQSQRNAALEERMVKVEKTTLEVHEEQIRGKSVSDDVSELKTGFNKLAEGITTLAVIQSQTAGLSQEMLRTRERLHDIEGKVRGFDAWRDGVTSELKARNRERREA